jgi:hypothetical protein
VLLSSNRVGIENLANVAYLPNRGATIFAMPLPLSGGSGAPARVVAFGWKDGDKCRISVKSDAVMAHSMFSVILVAYFIAL